MSKTPIVIHRPADGNYKLSWARNREITEVIFGPAWHEENSLHIRFFDKLWANHDALSFDGFVTVVDGWTRPAFDMLLDLIEGCRRMSLDDVNRLLGKLLGKELASEFLPVLAGASILFCHSPEYSSDLAPKGFSRVGPHPDAAKKAARVDDDVPNIDLRVGGEILVNGKACVIEGYLIELVDMDLSKKVRIDATYVRPRPRQRNGEVAS